MKIRHWILKDGIPVEASLLEWGLWLDSGKQQIDFTTVGAVEVSTIFLGIDVGIGRERDPMLFETLVSGPNDDRLIYRWYTLGDAKNGHYEIVTTLRAGLAPDTVFESSDE